MPHKRPHTLRFTTPNPTDIWCYMAYTADKALVTRPRHRPWTGLSLLECIFYSIYLLIISPQSKFASCKNTLRETACFYPPWVELSPFSQPWRVQLIGTLKCLVKCDISSMKYAWSKGWFCRLVSLSTYFFLTGISFVPFSSIRLGFSPLDRLGSLWLCSVRWSGSGPVLPIFIPTLWFGLFWLCSHLFDLAFFRFNQSVYWSDSVGHRSVWFDFDTHQLGLDQFSSFLFVQFCSFRCCKVSSGSFYLVFV